MRKLASIRKIAELRPIEGADLLELAIVDGWQCVVRKDQFEKDELVIFCEIDSVLPIREDLEFLRKSCYVKKDWLVTETNPTGEGFRLKSIKLRGQISQGLLIKLYGPTGWIHEFATYENVDNRPYPVWVENITDVGNYITPDNRHGPDMFDIDLSGVLNIVKWDPPVPSNLSGKVKGNFPSFIPKTDQPRIQNIKPSDLEKHWDDLFEVTIKLDGSSMTVYRFDDRLGVCSRNLELDIVNDDSTSFAKIVKESGLHEFLVEYDVNLAFQGELCGPGVQGNRENLKEAQMFVYDIYDINRGQYLDFAERVEWMAILETWQKLKGYKPIMHCPIVDSITIKDLTADDFLAMAEGPSLNHKIREGLVFKSFKNPGFSFKAISNAFLLGEE